MPPPPILRHSLRGNSSSHGDLTAATSRPSTRTSNTTTGQGRRAYPAALPSVLSSKFDGPVSGTVVIDHDYPAIDALVEMVTPDATPLNDPLTQEYLQDCVAEMDRNCHAILARGDPYISDEEDDHHRPQSKAGQPDSGSDEPSAGSLSFHGSSGSLNRLAGAAQRRQRQQQQQQQQQQQGNSIFSSGGRGSIEVSPNGENRADDTSPRRTTRLMRRLRYRLGSNAEDPDAGGAGLPSPFGRRSSSKGAAATESPTAESKRPRRRHLLREGGFVIFADEYLQAHPCSVVSNITQEFQLVHPSPVPVPPPDPKMDDKKRKVNDIKRLIKEAEQQHRPLFRRRPAELVYGEARYLARPLGNRLAQMEASPTGRGIPDDDDGAYFGTSVGSSVQAEEISGLQPPLRPKGHIHGHSQGPQLSTSQLQGSGLSYGTVSSGGLPAPGARNTLST